MRSRQHTTLRNEREFRECFSLSLTFLLNFAILFFLFLFFSLSFCQDMSITFYYDAIMKVGS